MKITKLPILLGIILAFSWMFFAQTSIVQATGFTIEANSPYINADGLCNLQEAIENANADSQIHADCPAGSGEDDINLSGRDISFGSGSPGTADLRPAPSDYTLDGYNAFEPITDPLIIRNGRIGADAFYDQCPRSAYLTNEPSNLDFRYFYNISTLTLKNVDLGEGCAVNTHPGTVQDQNGGAIYNVGTLIILKGSIEYNYAAGEGAAVYNTGTLVMANSTVFGSNWFPWEDASSIYTTATGHSTIFNTTFLQNLGSPAVVSGNSATNTTLINTTFYANRSSPDIRNVTIYNSIVERCAGTNVSSHSYSTLVGCSGFNTTGGANNTDLGLSAPGYSFSGSLRYYPLASGSAALAAGDNNLLPNESTLGVDIDGDGNVDDPIDVDEIGNPRRVGRVDVGAVEYQGACPYPSQYILGGNSTDLVDDLRTAIECMNGTSTDDSIDLDGQTVTLSDAPVAYDSYGYNGLPPITSNLTIKNGVIERDSSLISCASGNNRERFRFFNTNGADLTLDGVTLRNGCAYHSGSLAYAGGAILNLNDAVSIVNSHFEGNGADWGAAIFARSDYSIANSSFVGNNAGSAIIDTIGSSQGPGVTSFVLNSTFSGNNGGYMLFTDQANPATLINNTFSDNTNGRVFNFDNNSMTLTMYNNIIDHPTTACYMPSSFTESHNYQSDSSCGFTNNVIASVTLGSLTQASNGTYYHPLTAGTAIDGGNTGVLPSEGTLGLDLDSDGNTTDNPIEVDQRGAGYVRIIDGIVDAGAHESSCFDQGYNFPYTLGTVDSNLANDLQEAVACANTEPTDAIIDLNGQTVTFTSGIYVSHGFNALPFIIENLTLQNGVIERDSSLTTCDVTDDNTEFRFIYSTSDIHLNIDNMIFRNGCATDINNDGGADVRGGAIYLHPTGSTASLTVNNSIFEGNTARWTGSAIYARRITVNITNSSFTGNSITQNDAPNGVISIYDTFPATVVNSTFYQNSGGSILYNESGGALTSINNTISNNSASATGTNNGTINLHNTILANNTANNCAGTITSSYSYSDDNTCNFAANNGADNATITLESLTQAPNGTYYYPLLSGDALNGGDNALLPDESTLGVDIDGDSITDDPIDIDQIGNARISLGVLDAGAHEAGCELYGFPYTVGTVFNDLVEDLRHAIDCANDNATDDTIDLNGQIVSFDDAYMSGGTATPNVTTNITFINGTIERNSTFGCDNTDANPDFRLLYVENTGELTLDEVTLQHGCIDGEGGAIYSLGNLTMLDSIIQNNGTTIDSGADTAGIRLEGGDGLIINSIFRNNISDGGNGVGAFLCRFDTQNVTIVNSLFHENSATTSNSGAILSYCNLTLINSTITENTASATSGGLRFNGGTGYIYNSIVYGNTATTGHDINITAGTVSIQNSVYDATGVAGSITDNGGNITNQAPNFVDATNDDYTLGAGSPAINAGNNDLLPDESTLLVDVDGDGNMTDDPIDVDQIGGTRISLGTVDAGAYEVIGCDAYPFPYPLGTIQNDLAQDLRQAIDCANQNATDDTIDLNGQTITYNDKHLNVSTALPYITSNVTIQNGIIERNSTYGCSSADANPDFHLLTVYFGGDLTLEGVTLQHGCGDLIGAISSISNLTLLDSIIQNNSALSAGGVHLQDGNALIINSIFRNNTSTSTSDSAMLTCRNDGQNMMIVNSLFYDNSSVGNGGAILSKCNLTLINSTITDNSAKDGAGIRFDGGTNYIHNSIVYGNTATNGADDISVVSGTVYAQNSLYDGNGTSGTITDNGGNITNQAPNFVDSANNDYQLLAGSPAINAGDNNLLPDESTLLVDVDGDGNMTDDPIDVDQIGNARIAFDSVDTGAYEAGCELYGFPYTLGTIQNDLVQDLRDAVSCANGNGTADTIDLDGQTITASTGLANRGYNLLISTDTLILQNGTLERDSSLTTCTNQDYTDFRIIYATANLTVKNMTIRNGCASNSTGSSFDTYGGGVYVDGATLTILNTHFEGNTSTSHAGAIHLRNSTAKIINSSFTDTSGNTTITLSDAGSVIVNSTITGSSGGTAVINGNAPIIYNSTIAGNVMPAINISSGTGTLYNTVLANNTGNNCAGSITSSHSYSDDTTCNFSANNGADNASITLGSLTQASNGTFYYPLLGGDPINGGDNSLLPDEATLGVDVDGDGNTTEPQIEVDQIGNTRVLNILDAGAIEWQGVGTDVNNDGLVSPEDAIYVVNRLGTNDLSADVDGDGDVDQTDIDAVMSALGTAP